MPWLMSSILSGFSVFRLRRGWLTIEWLLFVWGLAVLAFTFSRAGIAVLILVAFGGFFFLRGPRSAQPAAIQPVRHTWLRRSLEVGVLLVVLLGVIYAASLRNPFFARIWTYWNEVPQRSLEGYFDYLGFGARFRYGEAAYNTYDAFPVFGVGLGNYAFYFVEMMPDKSLATSPELLRLIVPEGNRERLITAKNLYYRILAETGLVGMAAFAGFIAAILGCALFLWLSPDKEQKFWGRAGLLGLVAFIISAVSFDSFALPNMWVVFGLTTSATWYFMKEASA
jgi:hypothetical protein